VIEVERYANHCDGLVATVGKLDVAASASNVIPGQLSASLDVRHASDAVRNAALDHYLAYAASSAAVRGVTVTQATLLDSPAVPMDPTLSALLATAATQATGSLPPALVSGAGHDAMIVARRLPTAILFLRSPGGLSHHPDEAVLPGDVEAALATGVEFLHSLRDDRAMLERVTARRPRSRREDIHA